HGFIGTNLGAAKGVQKALEPIGRGPTGGVSGNDANASMSEAEEVARSVVRRQSVVYANAADGRVRKSWISVGVHHWDISQKGLCLLSYAIHRRHSHHSVDAAPVE